MNAPPNNSMDVRARAATFLSRCPLNFTLSPAVSSHINSVVRLLTKFENLGINIKAGFYEIQFRNNQRYCQQGLCSEELEPR